MYFFSHKIDAIFDMNWSLKIGILQCHFFFFTTKNIAGTKVS